MYYNSKGEIVKLNFKKLKYTGGTSEIYEQNSKTLFKKYYSFTHDELRMQYNIFKFLQELNHPNINHITDIFYNIDKRKKEYNGINVSNYILENKENLCIDAYQYYFLENTDINLEKQSTEYLIYNLKSLEELINIFTENKIEIYDLKYLNTIFNKDKMILIDLDCCHFNYNEDIDELYSTNMHQLIELFIDSFRKGVLEDVPYQNEIKNLFFLNKKELNNHKSLTESVSKKLKKCKTPLEYLKSN